MNNTTQHTLKVLISTLLTLFVQMSLTTTSASGMDTVGGTTASFSVSTPVQCLAGNSFSFVNSSTGTGLTYIWNFGDGSTSGDISPVHTYTAAGVFSVRLTASGTSGTDSISHTVTVKAAPSITTGSIVEVSCFGGHNGAVNINVSGGTFPYAYEWNTGATTQNISVLAAGTYNVVVTDASGCSSAGLYVVSQPSAIGVTQTQTNVSCYGWTNSYIILHLCGGTFPFRYSWSNGDTTSGIYDLHAGNYSVTVTDAAGCSVLDTYTITQPPLFTSAPVVTNATCYGGNSGSISMNAYGGTAPYTYSWSTGATTSVISSLSSGIYTSMATDVNGCTTNGYYTVGQPSAISALGTVHNVSCHGASNGSVNLTVSGGTAPYTFLWSNGEVSQNLTAAGAGTYTVHVTDVNGCNVSQVFIITQPSTLAMNIQGPSTLCAGGVVTLTDSICGGTWSSSNPFIASVCATGQVTGISAGLAIITYSVTNVCGSFTNTFGITVNSTPSTAPITGSTNLCTGGSTTLSETTMGGIWSSSNIAIASVTALGFVSGISSGSAVISYSVTNSCGTSNATVSVNVASLPIVSVISGPSSVCAGSLITLTDPTTGGVWSSSNSSIANVVSCGTVTGVSAGVANISYTVSNACGTAFAFIPVIINSTPSAGVLSGASSVCQGAVTTLTDMVSGGLWSSSNSLIATVNASGVVSGLSAGVVYITYTVMNSCGTANATKSVSVGALPVLGSISGSSTVCVGSTITLSDPVPGGTWSCSSAIAHVNSAGAVTGTSAGSLTITYSLTNACGMSSVYKSMTVVSAPSAGVITGSSSVCVGNSITLSDLVTGGSWLSCSPSIASVCATGVVTGVAAGSATISYSVSNSCGSAVATKIITVNTSPAIAPISGSSIVCVGSSTTLSDITVGGTWGSNNTTIATVNPSGLVSGLSAGPAIISYSVINSCGIGYVTLAIIVNGSTSPAAITGPSTVCAGATISLSDILSGGTWSSNNPSVATVSTSGIVTGVTSGPAIITYSVSSACGTASVTKAISVSPLPVVAPITGPSSVCAGSAIALADVTVGGTWSSSNTAIATTCICNSGHVTGVAPGIVNMNYSVSNTCGTTTVTYPVIVNAMPVIVPGVIAPVSAGSTVAYMSYTATGSPTQYSLTWNAAAHTAGFTDVLSAALPVSTISIAVPSGASFATFSATLTVTNGNCTSSSVAINVTVNAATNIYTFAGNDTEGYAGNNGAATAARLSHPYSVATDCSGNTYIADYENGVVR